MTKPHPHAEFLHALADGREDEFECHHENWNASDWRASTPFMWVIYEFPEDWTVRRKPRTIRIGDIDVPPPMRVAPACGTTYWIANPARVAMTGIEWENDHFDARWFKYGLCHLTKEAAELHRKALILASGGTP